MSKAVLVVDRKGLAKKLANKPKAFIIYELLQNAWDENVSEVTVTSEMLVGRPVVRITVEDDSPDGFQDLASVYTMFRDSKKAPDPTKRGRFELGEKLVLALAIKARITSTKGSVVIENDQRKTRRLKRKAGTIFVGEFRMTRAEYKEMCQQVDTLITPEGINTMFNGLLLPRRKPIHAFETTLQTVRIDEEGGLKTTNRKAVVNVYEPLVGETAHLYEMGIPVVETGDQWHYDVQQRVPINWERNNVPPSYLKSIRVEVLNALHADLNKEEAKEPWVTEAISDERCDASAITQVFDHRYGKKRVIYDGSDVEGTKKAMSEGYTVIHGGSESKGTWGNVRRFGTALPAGQVTPSPKVYNPDGHPEKVISMNEWTADMKRIASFSKEMFYFLINKRLTVVIVNEPMVGWRANFGGTRLCLNYGKLGKKWFALKKRDPEVIDLLIHEFVHHTVLDHLSHDMHKTATRLGAQLVGMALDYPKVFEE